MPDPVGLIGSINQDLSALTPKQAEGPGFKNLLQEQNDKVNQLQRDATEVIEDLATGGRDDVESVLIATQKADTAFRLLLQVRNKVLDAYEEVKQIRI